MAEENTTPPAGTEDAHGGDPADDEPDPRHRADQVRRQKLQSENADLRKWQSDRQAADQKADEERARKAGDFEKILATKDTKIRGLQETLDERDAAIESVAKDKRRGTFLDAILDGTGVKNRRMAALALPALGLEDDAPVNFTDRDARAARKALMKTAPELFGAGGSTEPKPPPGGGPRAVEHGTREYYQQLGKNVSSPQQSSAYEIATGRKSANTS